MFGGVGQLLTMAAVAALAANTVQDVGASSANCGFTLEESLPVGQSLDSESLSSLDPWELRRDMPSTRSWNSVGTLPGYVQDLDEEIVPGETKLGNVQQPICQHCGLPGKENSRNLALVSAPCGRRVHRICHIAHVSNCDECQAASQALQVSTSTLNDVGSSPSCYASSTSRSSWESRPIMPSTSSFGGFGGCSIAQSSVELRPESHLAWSCAQSPTGTRA